MSVKVVVVGLLAIIVVLSTTSLISSANPSEHSQKPEFSFHLYPKTHVVITNFFEDGSSLTVHCKSDDDDIGERVLALGESYEIDFYPSLTLSTLYFCSFSSPVGWVTGDVYRQTRDMARCNKNCLWMATAQNVSGFDMFGTPYGVLTWNH